jgi:hypothetical protein
VSTSCARDRILAEQGLVALQRERARSRAGLVAHALAVRLQHSHLERRGSMRREQSARPSTICLGEGVWSGRRRPAVARSPIDRRVDGAERLSTTRQVRRGTRGGATLRRLLLRRIRGARLRPRRGTHPGAARSGAAVAPDAPEPAAAAVRTAPARSGAGGGGRGAGGGGGGRGRAGGASGTRRAAAEADAAPGSRDDRAEPGLAPGSARFDAIARSRGKDHVRADRIACGCLGKGRPGKANQDGAGAAPASRADRRTASKRPCSKGPRRRPTWTRGRAVHAEE